MKVIDPGFEIIYMPEYREILRVIETAGRICYQSEPKGKPEDFIRRLILSGHESVIEAASATVKIICDRGVSHEIVRHRIGASYSQQSTRYCNFSKDKFGNEITVIRPFFFQEGSDQYKSWESAMLDAEFGYFDLLGNGATPEQARVVLPNSLKTEIVVTMNMRAWRHFFTLRCAPAAHPQMCQIALPLLDEFHSVCPVLFQDLFEIHKDAILKMVNHGQI